MPPRNCLHFIRTNAPLFARVGSVVATYRTRGNARFGPYYRLIYRQNRRQRSLYLGRNEDLADQVRQALNELQQPRNHRLAYRRDERRRKAELLQIKRQWQQAARNLGLKPHGWNIRGWRTNGYPRFTKILKHQPKPQVRTAASPYQPEAQARTKNTPHQPKAQVLKLRCLWFGRRPLATVAWGIALVVLHK